MITNEQKKQLLDYLGYYFHVTTNTYRQENYVCNPDEWMYSINRGSPNTTPDFEAKQLSVLIDIAWVHHERNERAVYIEWLLLDCGASAFVGDSELYNELWQKHGSNPLPDAMKMYYE